MPDQNARLMQLTLPAIGIDLRVLLPARASTENLPQLTSGTILLGTGQGSWHWGERHLVHSRNDLGELTCIDLARHIVVTMTEVEAQTSCLTLLPPPGEPYPFRSLDEALQATRNGLPLFAAPQQSATSEGIAD